HDDPGVFPRAVGWTEIFFFTVDCYWNAQRRRNAACSPFFAGKAGIPVAIGAKERRPMPQTRKLAVFPAFHKVAGRRVVVVGGGAGAAAKIRLLSETKADIIVFADALDKETGADLIAAQGEWRGRAPSLSDLQGAALVFAASGNASR